ncbi:Para-aminobenzoate synthase [Vanrija pseudolonga]|uniref:aminodeoxychorismate synthase n=1 Tax=Vanrija pseudolonga TaxID=143232 RepID=A0AAF1BTB5_9TREE|nr:Para-aminobenzoate synthase [Vanrija pseudolonga]
MVPPLPRTVIIDYYDSYTNNLLILFTQLYSDSEVLRKVVVIKADKYDWPTFRREVIPNTDCVILSPGPGRPDHPADIGFALELLREHPVPILGVCLGHQALGVAFGGKIMNTPKITHGHVVRVVPVSPPLGPFASPIWPAEANAGFDAVVYNSLAIDPASVPSELEITAWSDPQNGSEPTIQGLAHKEFPLWGVQYHPESISSTRGNSLLHAFLDKVHEFHHCPPVYPRLEKQIVSACTYRVAASAAPTRSTSPVPGLNPVREKARLQLAERRFGDLGKERETSEIYERVVRTETNRVGEIWLDGKSPSRPTTTSLTAPTFVITYALSTRTVNLYTPANPETPAASLVLHGGETFWSWFNAGQSALAEKVDGEAGGFRGGWVGWFTYEMKEESLAGYRRPPQAVVERVDAVWSWSDKVLERREDGEWIARAVIADSGSPTGADMLDWLHSNGVEFGVSAASADEFISKAEDALKSAPQPFTTPTPAFPQFRPRISGETHMSRIDACREAIREGESYELNQTMSFIATLPPDSDRYATYIRLRRFNPAYYSTFISFPGILTPKGRGLHVLSSSPERFLQIIGDVIEMRPIKGTARRVQPGQCVCVPGRGCGGTDKGSEACIAEAKYEDERRGKELSEDLKERAENLMIVDLIRSDLLSCCVPSTVKVPQLIALESYGVHNLVTTVRGTLAPQIGAVEAVKRCFPPGSMTGAPKLRSVQLLDDFEEHYPRGIYSGALGYISLCGSADLSVVIRTMVLEGDQLSIGAGGAITWLSEREGEWKEVLTKVQSVVGPLEGL